MKLIYPWQQSQWESLVSRYQHQRMPHALLLTGAAGMGKITFAKALAAFLLCSQPKQQACGHCQHCQLLQAETHPDFYLIQPEESKNIKIEQIRFLSEKLSQTAQLSKSQVVIIYPAEAMNQAAANALLKTLEEPAGSVYLILISHQTSLLPATIRSRCQLINFLPNNKQLIETWLMQETKQTPQQIHTSLRLAGYIPLKALQLAQADASKHEVVKDFYQLLEGKQSPLKLASAYSKENPKEILQKLTLILHDIMKLHYLSGSNYIMHQEHSDLLKILANKMRPSQIVKWLDTLFDAQQLLSKNINLNSQLLFETVLISFVNNRAISHVS